jgi:hypothetical protein
LLRKILLLSAIFFLPSNAGSLFAYSVLTHQAIIDSSWDEGILPLLKRRFPKATEEEIRTAHSYAYGGSIIQDSGYFPFGNTFFTNLLHYVRSGDFIEEMVAGAGNLDEYAFALGALAHYAADNTGHPLAVNRSVPLVYPELNRKYGAVVTYEESPAAHLKMEFGFDVLQVARGHYTSQAYRDFIGFQVSKPLLERTFARVYSLQVKDLFKSVDLALGTYRRSVSTIIPRMTKVAWEIKKSDIEKNNPGITDEKFVYRLPRADYEKMWDRRYERPGTLDRFLALVFRLFPKIGILRPLSFKPPTPEAEQLFLSSFDATLTRYRGLLAEAGNGQRLDLKNMDFDTGRPTHAGEYLLCDETYRKFLLKLADRKFEGMSADLRTNLLEYFRDAGYRIEKLGKADERRKLQQALSELQSLRPSVRNAEQRRL